MRVYRELGPLHDAADDELLRDADAGEALVEAARGIARGLLALGEG
jgi:hypothetical protein